MIILCSGWLNKKDLFKKKAFYDAPIGEKIKENTLSVNVFYFTCCMFLGCFALSSQKADFN